MLGLDDGTLDKTLLTNEQVQQIGAISALYAKKSITANEMEWQIRRIIQKQWNVYCNVAGGLRFGMELSQQ